MLFSLNIENVAVIKSLELNFSQGFSALTGQTGAGKSVIIDCIGLLLGKKADKDIVRHGESFALVSGLFTDISDSTRELFSENGVYPDDDGNILIQRTVTSDGKSQVKINGRAASLTVLKEIGGKLISINGQHDTTALIDDKTHILTLDAYSDNEALLKEYSTFYGEYEKILTEIRTISEKEKERERLIEILEYQIKDIDALALTENEEDELVDKKVKIKNSERITKNAGFVYKALKGSEKGSISFLLDKSISALSSLSDVIGEFDTYAERLRDCLDTVSDIAEEVYAAVEEIDDDPIERLNEIESRLDKISKIKRKYGLTLKDVLAFRDNAAEELESLKNAENILAELNIKLDRAYDAALRVAMEIHERRKKFALELEEKVKSTLEFLDMPKVVFFTRITQSYEKEKYKLTPDGIDDAVFYISANRGIEPQPLSKIASGGELSRVMLALKSVISEKGATETLIFDEIDAGVSGKTARKIGIKMMELSKSSQIICVTHSAQIASLSDGHFLIEKTDVDGKTASSVVLLDDEGRIKELSRILGGINVTDSQRAAAKDMLKEREIYK